MLVKKIYEETAVGAVGTLTYGGVSNDAEEYEAFADHVADLESMEGAGLVQIIYRHRESTTGSRFVDLVQFTRLR